MNYKIQSIDSILRNPNMTKRIQCGDKNFPEWVVAKPCEPFGLYKFTYRIYKAFMVLTGKADTVKYSKYQ